MTIRPTVQLGDPLLRRPARPAHHPRIKDLRGLERDLADTLAEWRASTTYGRGIAAPQIGVAQRVVFLAFDRPLLRINPEVVDHSDTWWEPWDTCLSFSVDFFCKVRRWRWIEVSYTDAEGRTHVTRADGELGELLQHEIDHLDGVLATDRMSSPQRCACARSSNDATETAVHTGLERRPRWSPTWPVVNNRHRTARGRNHDPVDPCDDYDTDGPVRDDRDRTSGAVAFHGHHRHRQSSR